MRCLHRSILLFIFFCAPRDIQMVLSASAVRSWLAAASLEQWFLVTSYMSASSFIFHFCFIPREAGRFSRVFNCHYSWTIGTSQRVPPTKSILDCFDQSSVKILSLKAYIIIKSLPRDEACYIQLWLFCCSLTYVSAHYVHFSTSEKCAKPYWVFSAVILCLFVTSFSGLDLYDALPFSPLPFWIQRISFCIFCHSYKNVSQIMRALRR